MVRGAQNPSEGAVAAWARLMRVSQALLPAVEADLKAQGFPSLSWYDGLLELRRAGSDGLRPYELQSAMLLAQYNMSRLANRLIEAGYVERERSEADGRGQVLRITQSGEALLRRMWPAYRHAIAIHFAEKLSTQELAKLTAILGRLV